MALHELITHYHTRIVVLAAALATGAASCNLYYGNGDPNDKSLCKAANDGFVDSFPLDLGPAVQAEVPPPPLSGGTLALTPDDSKVVAADPDRDQVYIVDLESGFLSATIPLNAGDEPGRVIVDPSGRAHVALRSGSAVVVIDVNNGTLLDRREVCAAPRGLAMDEASGNLYVACHGGELVTMDPATGQVVREQRFDVGLRDVVVDADYVYVSKFRTAEVLVLSRQGALVETMRPPVLNTETFDFERGEFIPARFEPAVGWRMIAQPGGGVVMMHQRGRQDEISIGRGGYGGDPCAGSIVHGAITRMKPGQPTVATQALGTAVLPVDLALVDDSPDAVIVAAGNNTFMPAVLQVRADEQPHEPDRCESGGGFEVRDGQAIAVAVTASRTTVVQLREPAQLSIFRNGDQFNPALVNLSPVSRVDTGHTMFHRNSGSNIACASCHPEGSDDSRVWEFDCIGPRRTQSLQFGLLGTEPFHWDGDMDSFGTLMNEVFVGRMGGGQPTPEQTTAMASWLDTLETPPRSAPVDTTQVERGRLLFQDATVGCQTCHAGTKFTSNQSFDVGTGGAFQVPSLIGISNRAPYIHTGCAPTLRDRFTDSECGGGDSHGVVSSLTTQEIDDLIAYLETL